MNLNFYEDIFYKGWVIFADGHVEDVISARKYNSDGKLVLVTESGGRYMYKRIYEDNINSHHRRVVKLPSHQFSEFINGEWRLTEKIRSFNFNTAIPR